jgi:Domain of unknown function (DUF222)
MSRDPFPDHEQRCETRRQPGADARNGDGDDFDYDACLDRLVADADAGRVRVPGPTEIPGQAEGLSLIAAGPDELAALGVDDLAGLDIAGFAQGGTADTMPPGPVLTALAEAACAAGTLGDLSDNQVLGLAGAARRLTALGSWLQTAAVAEFAGRRLTGDTRGQVAGQVVAEFASHELAPELVVTDHAAEDLMRHSLEVTRRLPACSAALRAGQVTGFQVKIAAESTACLSDQDAAEADRLIAVAAPRLTPGQLRAMCARTVLMIDPEAAKRRKDLAAKDARIERFQEHSGTAALCGRDLPTDEVLASSTHIDGVARQLRAAGMRGTLCELRVRVYLDLTQGKDPRARLAGAGQDTPAARAMGAGHDGTGQGGGIGEARCKPDQAGTGDDGAHRRGPGHDGAVQTGLDHRGAGHGEAGHGGAGDLEAWNDENYGEDEGGEGGGGGGPRPAEPSGPDPGGGRAAFPALINLLVPAGTLLGWSGAPGEAAGWGLLDPATTRDLTQAASQHPKTRWCVTVVGADGTATAHGCAPGRHPFDPGTDRTGGGNRDGPAAGRDGKPGPEAAVQVAQLLRQLKVALAPIAKGACDHRHHEDRYEVSRKLKHLVKARTGRCVAPGCNRHAAGCDADHTIPWPDGPSCECNLGPPCRRHHRCKQSPGWKLEQPSPGVMTWTNPAGRTHTTRPTTYEV